MEKERARQAVAVLKKYIDGRDYDRQMPVALAELDGLGHSGISENVGRFQDAIKARRGQALIRQHTDLLAAVGAIERYIDRTA